jgi:CheY-like chemotaxis protein
MAIVARRPRFDYNLPALELNVPDISEKRSVSISPTGGTMSKPKCRILYVDDHEDSAEMFRLMLSSQDYEVQIALSVEEAMAKAQADEFDLYVLDKRLPDGSGTELCRMLNTFTPGVPCIFYSGDAYEIHRQEAFAAGARAYIPKPDVDALIQTVHRLMSERECATA